MSERPREPRRTPRPPDNGRPPRPAAERRPASGSGSEPSRRGEQQRSRRVAAPEAGARGGASGQGPGSGRGSGPGGPRGPRGPQGSRKPSGGGSGRGGRSATASGLRLARPRPRLRLIAFALTFVMLVFTVRLLQVQAVDASAYAEKAAVHRYITVPLAAERGTVSSRDGTSLATTVDAYDITADPFLFTEKQTGVTDAPARAAAYLAPVLGEDEEELAAKLARKNTRYVLLARQESPRTWQKIKKLKSRIAEKAAEDKGADVLAGIYREEHAKRVYPNKELASSVLGFVNAAGEGGAGIEALLDTQLAGKDGKITYAQSGGRQVPTAGVEENPARPGADIDLTLDRDIQWAAQQAIGEQVKESEADRGYVIVQDTRTGELLAMANAPDFDPNDIRHADPEALGNAAVQDAYEPGSTAKLMSMAAVLEEGKATPATEVTVPNRLKRADRSFSDDIDHPTWHLTLNGVLAKSSNIGTILATEQLGETRKQINKVLHSYLSDFGIGRESGLGLPGETSGILPAPEKWNASQQYTIPFGQGFSLNAVQAASIYSTIANGGVRTEPSLVRGSTGPDGRYEKAPAPEKNRVVSEKTAKTLATMLESVVADMEGTGTTARIPGYRVAGKTGTANRVDPRTGRYKGYTASFAGFAPADKPRVTVYCAVQNPTKGSYFGSEVCGPVYKKVMKFALKSLQIPPTGADPANLPVLARSAD